MQIGFQCNPRGGHNRYNCDFNFFKKWTAEMAYVLGFLYADGAIIDAISSRTQYIQFTSKDRELLEKIRMALNSEHPIYIRPPHLVAHKNGTYKSAELFILRIGSKRMFKDLTRFGVAPAKSKTTIFPKVPSSYLNHFVRGYFDGDGCVFISKRKGIAKLIIIEKLSVIFTSGSLLFLKNLTKILKNQLALNHDKIYKSNRALQLRYPTNDSLKIFKFLYKPHLRGLYLQRKFDIFKNYFELRPQKIDSEITSVLENLV